MHAQETLNLIDQEAIARRGRISPEPGNVDPSLSDLGAGNPAGDKDTGAERDGRPEDRNPVGEAGAESGGRPRRDRIPRVPQGLGDPNGAAKRRQAATAKPKKRKTAGAEGENAKGG